MITNLEHIGIAVANEQEAVALFTKLLGRSPYKEEIVEREGVKTIFLELANVKLELLVALNEDSPVAKFIQQRGQGIHHLAFEVDDIRTQMQQASVDGFKLLADAPKAGADNKEIVFLHPKTTGGVLVEFCQEKNA
jgi:methylmalonyl-CoA/ethylmalonyl-CoA epimerase